MKEAGLSVNGLASQFASGSLDAEKLRDRLLEIPEAVNQTRGIDFLNEDAQTLLDIVTELAGAQSEVDRVVGVRAETQRDLAGVTSARGGRSGCGHRVAGAP